MKSSIFVFSGPSGSGKSTIIKSLLQKFNNIGTTVSCTTRAKRTGEVDGIDYHFLKKDDFSKYIQDNKFIEHVECYGNKYGTLKNSIDHVLSTKDACILDLEFEGAYKILSNQFEHTQPVGILVLPPSLRTMETRLCGRKSETDDSMRIRLEESFNVLNIGNYQNVIINANLETSTQTALEIFSKYGIVCHPS